MGKSSSKLSAESLERLKQSPRFRNTTSNKNTKSLEGTESSGDTHTTMTTSTTSYSINEKDLKNWCTGFNKDFPDAQLTGILDNEQRLAPFLTDVFYQEVEVSECMSTLFRGNCLASKIMSHCFRNFGSKYLKQLLEPHIKPLLSQQTQTRAIPTTTPIINDSCSAKCKSDRDKASSSPTRLSFDSTANIENTVIPDSMLPINDHGDQVNYNSNNNCINTQNSAISYEIDSARLEKDGDIDVNQRNLLKLTRQILNSILVSANEFPPQLNSMCICLRQVLCEKYPNSDTNLKAVGTVIFLRFINPAIVSPYEAGIVDEQPSQRTLRGLMLVSKILQNIANNVEFSKEEHMLPFNDFVRTQFEPLRRWVSEISSDRN